MSPSQTTALPKILSDEIANFKDKAAGFRLGTVPDEEFKPFRLVNGVYGQRQQDVQMMRIKVPGGQFTPEQAIALGDVSRDFAPLGIGHVTTRQAVQVHFIKLENVPAVMERLAQTGLTTREACGNTVRNITCTPFAGLASDEAFDPFPYSFAAYKHLIRRPEFTQLPRKFKIAFNSGKRDSALGAINDVALYAEVRIVDGKLQRGFKVKVGGGLGASPQDAWTYSDFLPENEVLPHIEAIITHFNEKGERKNRMAARIKFLIRKEGFDVFKAEVAKILAAMPKEIPFPLEPGIAEPQGDAKAVPPTEGPEGYTRWFKLNCWPQKQKGFHLTQIKLTLGDVSYQQWYALAKVMVDFGRGEMRTAVDQNLILPWIPSNKLAELYTVLKDLKLADLGPDLIGDVTSCPGADTCNLGLTSSRGLGAKLTQTLTYTDESNDDLIGSHIKISGCPNSCGQHHIGTFGFFGNVRKVDGKDSPHFQMLIGGGVDENGASFGRVIGRVPSRRAPEAVRAFIANYRANRQADETLTAYLRRMDLASAKKLLEPLTEVVSNDPELFKDNGSEVPFIFDGVGASECA